MELVLDRKLQEKRVFPAIDIQKSGTRREDLLLTPDEDVYKRQIHAYVEEKQKKKRNKVVISVLFAISGLICWCGISQVISNSVVSSFKNAFSIPPIYTTVVLVAVAAVIVLRKNATVKVLDMICLLYTSKDCRAIYRRVGNCIKKSRIGN